MVKKICSLIEVEFSQDLLSWESYDSFDPKWEVPPLAKAVEDKFGHFTRANRLASVLNLSKVSFVVQFFLRHSTAPHEMWSRFFNERTRRLTNVRLHITLRPRLSTSLV